MRLLGKVVLLGVFVLSLGLVGCSDNKVIAPNASNFKETKEKPSEGASMKVPTPPANQNKK